MKMNNRYLLLIAMAVSMLAGAGCDSKAEVELQDSRPNLLFIAVDDLKPLLGCYGDPYAITPNLDRLASGASLFTKHYVTSPTCGASRFAMLRGLWPRTMAETRNSACYDFMSTRPEVERPESFFHHLRRQGYHTVGIGKIPHSADNRVYGYNDPISDSLEMPHSWDEFHFNSTKWGTGWDAFFGYADGSNRQGKQRQVLPYERAEVADTAYPDGIMADMAVKKLEEMKQYRTPFALATGFFKPHLPWTAPQEYWDLYDRSQLPLSSMMDIPEGIELASLGSSGEFNGYQLGKEKASLDQPLSEDYQRELIHAYYASVSYVDQQIGKVLTALTDLGLEENTMVVVWGDHGWHLGDFRRWGKHTLFDDALRSAFIVKLPGQDQESVIDQVVSSVDIYPTIIDALDLPPVDSLDGSSLVPIVKKQVDQPRRAFSYFRGAISMREDRYRITHYPREENPIELFDFRNSAIERKNVAKQQALLIDSLNLIWEQGNTGYGGGD